jgi:hypothetical protein
MSENEIEIREQRQRTRRRERRMYITHFGCATLEGRENASDFLLVQGVGCIAGLRRSNHEIGHDLAVEIRA